MSFKDIIKNAIFEAPAAEEEAKVKATPAPPVTSFPVTTAAPSATSFPVTPAGTSFVPPAATSFSQPQPTQVGNPFMDKIIEVYDKRFEALNQPGYDFFEFYQSVSEMGIDNPQVYTMGLGMAVRMDKSVTKETLLEQADFYIKEIDNIHTTFDTDGNLKAAAIATQKETDTRNLTTDIQSLTEQISTLQTQLGNKTAELATIDSKFDPELNEIKLKLAANDMAKEHITTSLVKVKNNLSTI